jgi:2-C-methyl-D-erythritol 4-phosphate cytidylyltransferase
VTAQPNPRGDVAVLVPAAGMGLRLGPGAPKALRPLAGQPLLLHALRRVAAAPSVAAIVIAAPPAEADAIPDLLANLPAGWPRVIVVPGGATRQESVAVALAVAPPDLEIVLVHDAARALAPPALIESVAAAVRDRWDAVVPVLAVVDTIKEVTGDGVVVGTIDRAALRVVQTPQGFRRWVLTEAHRVVRSAPFGAGPVTNGVTDDAGLVERIGVPVHCVPGSELAIKITRPLDLAVAEYLLNGEPRS